LKLGFAVNISVLEAGKTAGREVNTEKTTYDYMFSCSCHKEEKIAT